MIEPGHVRELYRYPVKSMASVALDSALLGWYGLEGDRRYDHLWRRIIGCCDQDHHPR